MSDELFLLFLGSGSGIGKAVCSRFAKEGAKLVMIDRSGCNPQIVDIEKPMEITGDVSCSKFTKSVFDEVQVRKFDLCGRKI